MTHTRPTVSTCVLVLGLLGVWTLHPPASVRAEDPPDRVVHVYTPSELPRLDKGVELPLAGTYTLKVWAPARQVWSVAAEGSTLTLKVQSEGNDLRPRWQTVGNAELKGETFRVVVAGQGGPVPALLALSTDPAYDPAVALDLIRGRVDSVDPPLDPRRTTVRTNQQGNDFHAPATEQAWRDRARAVREQLLVAMGLWPAPAKTPLKPRIVGKLERDGYTIERVELETLPGFTLCGNLYRPWARRASSPWCSVRTDTGATAA
jgi:hypothetical protein